MYDDMAWNYAIVMMVENSSKRSVMLANDLFITLGDSALSFTCSLQLSSDQTLQSRIALCLFTKYIIVQAPSKKNKYSHLLNDVNEH